MSLDFWINLLLQNWFLISGSLILVGLGLLAAQLFYKALLLYRARFNLETRFEGLTGQQNVHEVYRNRLLRYISMHIQVIFGLPVSGAKVGTTVFFILSVTIGVVTGYYLFDVYGHWDADLPYDQVGVGISIIIGACASGIPFLFLHAILQQRRAKLSHQILRFTEEFEKKYLINRDAYAVLHDLADAIKNATLQRLTYNLIQGLQSKSRYRAEYELQLFEHQIGTRFAEILCILLKEALGLTADLDDHRREQKDIRVGIRSLIEKMHAIERVNQEDRPEKRDIFQIGLATFPCLYGAYYITSGIMTDESAHKYLFESPAQLNIFVLAIILGFAGICVNILISRRKFDL